MSPSAFTFKLSVPNDPGQVLLVTEVARHAATYAGLEAGAAAGFVERATAAAAAALAGGAGAVQAVLTAADGVLTLTLGGERVSQPLP